MQTTFLMPDYDEYGMSYKDRNAIQSTRQNTSGTEKGNENNRYLVINGRVEGNWKRTINSKVVELETDPLAPLNEIQQQLVQKAVSRYRSFVQPVFDHILLNQRQLLRVTQKCFTFLLSQF